MSRSCTRHACFGADELGQRVGVECVVMRSTFGKSCNSFSSSSRPLLAAVVRRLLKSRLGRATGPGPPWLGQRGTGLGRPLQPAVDARQLHVAVQRLRAVGVAVHGGRVRPERCIVLLQVAIDLAQRETRVAEQRLVRRAPVRRSSRRAEGLLERLVLRQRPFQQPPGFVGLQPAAPRADGSFSEPARRRLRAPPQGVGGQVAGLDRLRGVGIAGHGLLQSPDRLGVAALGVQQFAEQEQRIAPFLACRRQRRPAKVVQQQGLRLLPVALFDPRPGGQRPGTIGGRVARMVLDALAEALQRPCPIGPGQAAPRPIPTRACGPPLAEVVPQVLLQHAATRCGSRALPDTRWRPATAGPDTAASSIQAAPTGRRAVRRGGIGLGA